MNDLDTISLALDAEGHVRMDFVPIPSLGLRMSRTCVSRSAFACYAPDYPAGGGDAVHVSWDDAARFCKWLYEHRGAAAAQGGLFRLPTAMEWESCVLCRTAPEPPWKDICPDFGSDADFAEVAPLLANGTAAGGVNEWGLYHSEPSL